MSIGTIIEMVQDRLAFANDPELESKIVNFRNQLFYIMQPQTGKSDEDVEDETTYKPIERIMFADGVSYMMLKSRVVTFSAGSTASSTGAGTKRIKKAKAAVVETEFDYNDSFVLEADKVMMDCKTSACRMANSIGYEFYFCDSDTDTVYAPFVTVTDC